MTTTSGPDSPRWRAEHIPYVPQANRRSPGRCGVAALAMVLRSFGHVVDPSTLWHQLGISETEGARTQRLAQLAQTHGLTPLIVQARSPWQLLERCQTPSLRVILNHRLACFQPSGHFSVLVGMDGAGIDIHDPGQGPWRRLSRTELELLWRPEAGPSQIAGYVLLALAEPGAQGTDCRLCGQPIPEALACPSCAARVALQPGGIVGCLAPDCPERAWARLYCVNCDAVCAEAGATQETGHANALC